MSQSLEEKLSEQFYNWELRGRGWRVWDYPVEIEPPFRPFFGHFLPPEPPVDDGRRHTWLSAFFERLFPSKKVEVPLAKEEEEPEPELFERNEELVELAIALPRDFNTSKDRFEHFLQSLFTCQEPIAFEIIGSAKAITLQFSAYAPDAAKIRNQIDSYYPDVIQTETEGSLREAWNSLNNHGAAIIDFGLDNEFMVPISTIKNFGNDPFTAVFGTLENVQEGELAIVQVLFVPNQAPWSESIIRSVTTSDERPFFVNAPELVKHAHSKIAKPLYSAVLRIAVRSDREHRIYHLVTSLFGALSILSSPFSNSLLPLSNDEYDFDAHEADLMARQSRRSGMILNSDELISLVHLPTSASFTNKLLRNSQKTHAAPETVLGHRLVLGENRHAGRTIIATLSDEQRMRHMHLIGGSGTGKSTLLLNIILQDIENGQGVGVLDPHGDLIEKILGRIPEERIDDVVLFDPSDEAFPVGFNILSAHSDLEQTLLASDLVSVFQRLSTSWGDQMTSVLGNAILAFLESSQGGTLADIRRFLVDKEFRTEFLATVRDPDIVFYWQKEFPLVAGKQGPVLTRLDTFLRQKTIRYMVGQKENRLDFGKIMDSGKIFLAKLPQGLIGEENAYLLGTLLVSKFHQLAMVRQRMDEAARRNFVLFADEFHHFATPSMAAILSGTRKYRLGLVLAHQELHQLQRSPEVASAVMGNSGVRICFRIGDQDARVLENGFSHFTSKDIQNLSTGEAICRVERSEWDFNLATSVPDEPNVNLAIERKDRIIALSRQKYATPRERVAESLAASRQIKKEDEEPIKKKVQSQKIVADPLTSPLIEQPQAVIAPAFPAPKPIPEPARETKLSSSEKSLPSLGRGGAIHQAIQRRIKEVAQDLGFFAVIEKQILGGIGSVDVALEKGRLSIACEITVTTDAEHEIEKIKTCLNAGFSHVLLISPDIDRVSKLEKSIASTIKPPSTQTVQCFTPDSSIEYLQRLAREQLQEAGTAKTCRGFKVKSSFKSETSSIDAQKEKDLIDIIAKSARKPKR